MRRLARLVLPAWLLLGACAEAPPPVANVAPPRSSAAALPAVTAAPAPLPPSAPPPYGNAEQLGRWVDAYTSAFGSRWGDSASLQGYLAVAEDGKMIFHKAYGKANREKGLVADDDTRFRVGSITKQFTAAAILTLAKKGLLKVEDPIRKYLPDYPAATGDRITLHHLLTHTSGIPSYTNDEALMKRRAQPMSRQDLIATFANKPLDFEPGAKYAYSNSGYFLLGVIIEKVSGKSYEDYLQEAILRPAGMTRTSTVDAPDAPDTAAGYQVNALDELAPAPAIDMSIPFAAGALRSTARDLVAWDSALRGEAILDAASKARMYTPEKDGYAYGWDISKSEGKQVIAHGGGIDGFSSYIARVPEAKLVVIALSNNEDFSAGALAKATLQMALSGKPVEPKAERAFVPLDAAAIKVALGDYALTEASRKELDAKLSASVVQSVLGIAVTTEAGRLFFKPVGQTRIQIFRSEEGVLFTKKGGIEITLDAGSPAPAFTLKQNGLQMRYERGQVEDKDKDKADAKKKTKPKKKKGDAKKKTKKKAAPKP